MSGVILLTGATGFLGAQITRRILGQTDHSIIAIVRAEDDITASRRLARAWWDFPELPEFMVIGLWFEVVMYLNSNLV